MGSCRYTLKLFQFVRLWPGMTGDNIWKQFRATGFDPNEKRDDGVVSTD